MHIASMETSLDQATRNQPNGPSRLVVAGAGLLAFVSASCCILPIGLSIIGLGGTWLFYLSPFVANRVPIVVVVGAVLLWAWYRVWTAKVCKSRLRSTIAILLPATLFFLVAATAPLWEAEATRTMFALWRPTRP